MFLIRLKQSTHTNTYLSHTHSQSDDSLFKALKLACYVCVPQPGYEPFPLGGLPDPIREPANLNCMPTMYHGCPHLCFPI